MKNNELVTWGQAWEKSHNAEVKKKKRETKVVRENLIHILWKIIEGYYIKITLPEEEKKNNYNRRNLFNYTGEKSNLKGEFIWRSIEFPVFQETLINTITNIFWLSYILKLKVSYKNRGQKEWLLK